MLENSLNAVIVEPYQITIPYRFLQMDSTNPWPDDRNNYKLSGALELLIDLAEAIVLYDEIITPDSGSLCQRFALDKNASEPFVPINYNSEGFPLSQLKNNPVLHMLPSFLTTDLESVIKMAEFTPKAHHTTYYGHLDSTKRRISMEQSMKLPALVALHDEANHLVRTDHTLVCSLSGNYSRIKNDILSFREAISTQFQEVSLVNIPPIALRLFKRMKHFDLPSFTSQVLELREEYSTLRNSMSELKKFLSDTSISPIKKHDKIIKWERIWNTVSLEGSKYNVRKRFTKATKEVFGLSTADLTDHNVYKSNFNITKLISNIIGLGINSYYSWNVRILQSSLRDYFKTSDEEMISCLSRLMEIDKELLMNMLTKKDNRMNTDDSNLV